MSWLCDVIFVRATQAAGERFTSCTVEMTGCTIVVLPSVLFFSRFIFVIIQFLATTPKKKVGSCYYSIQGRSTCCFARLAGGLIIQHRLQNGTTLVRGKMLYARVKLKTTNGCFDDWRLSEIENFISETHAFVNEIYRAH